MKLFTDQLEVSALPAGCMSQSEVSALPAGCSCFHLHQRKESKIFEAEIRTSRLSVIKANSFVCVKRGLIRHSAAVLSFTAEESAFL